MQKTMSLGPTVGAGEAVKHRYIRKQHIWNRQSVRWPRCFALGQSLCLLNPPRSPSPHAVQIYHGTVTLNIFKSCEAWNMSSLGLMCCVHDSGTACFQPHNRLIETPNYWFPDVE